MSDSNFSSTSSDFKIETAASFGNYLLNMDNRSEFGQGSILSKIDSFNQSNTGGLQLQRQGENFGNFAKGTLNLGLQYKGNTYPIKYEKINE
jgi:hypothetical protein